MSSALRLACQELALWRSWYGAGPSSLVHPSEIDVDDIVAEMKQKAENVVDFPRGRSVSTD